jgi:hypothetical protein
MSIKMLTASNFNPFLMSNIPNPNNNMPQSLLKDETLIENLRQLVREYSEIVKLIQKRYLML